MYFKLENSGIEVRLLSLSVCSKKELEAALSRGPSPACENVFHLSVGGQKASCQF